MRLSLNPGERIFDASGLYDDIWSASSIQKPKTLAEALFAYAAPEGVQVASNGGSGLIAQVSNSWGNVNPIGGTITLIGGALYIIVDEGGKFVRWVFRSESGTDDRTPEQKKTDEAVGELLKGATPTDKKGNPLKPGQTRKAGDVENFVKPSDNPKQKHAQDIEQLAREAGTPLDTQDTPDGEVQTTKLLDGGSAGAYPVSDSTGEPSIQINLREKSPTRRKIKIRYRDNRRATIIIPTV